MTALIPAEAILIDLDGTLIDTAPDLAGATNRMLGFFGMAKVTETEVRRWIGNGVPRLVKRALTGKMDGEPEAGLFARGYSQFMAFYAEDLCLKSRPYPGVVETLEWLREEEFTLGCVTNKAADFTLPLLEQLGLRDLFASVVSGDTTPRKKPSPEPLLYAAAKMGVSPSSCILVGDSEIDIRAAHSARMPVICVTYGYNRGEDLNALNPAVTVDSFKQIRQLVIHRGTISTNGRSTE